MSRIEDHINNWSQKLGVLPIFLFSNQKLSDGQFILLNGNQNNFCVDFTNEFTSEKYKSFAWSAGVDNFLNIVDETVFLHKWYKTNVEKISLNTIERNLPDFYEYLGRVKSNKENAIVPFSIRVFNSLRNLLRFEDGKHALQAFLYLLASLQNEQVDLNMWGLSEEARSIKERIPSNDWAEILDNFRSGLRSDNLTPEPDLILRHCAGRLFEEAHFAAFVNYQMSLFGHNSDITFKSRSPQQYGAYFTPSYIARSIVEEVLRTYTVLPNSLTIFDPACGSSEFLIETLRQLKVRGYDGKIKVIGWDASPIALEMSRFILKFETKEWGDNVSVELEQRNSLIKENRWPKDIDIILMNPPFRSWELMNEEHELRDNVREILGDVYLKNPNQAAAFFRLSLDALREGGIMGCLLPSAIFNSDSHSGLRELASFVLTPNIIGRLGSFLFENALVDACVFVAEKKENKGATTTLLWTQNIANVTSKALRELRKLHHSPFKIVNEPDQFSIYKVQNELIKHAASWMPLSYESATLKEGVEEQITLNKLVRVKEVLKVHRGADPGRKYFKVSKEFYEILPKGEKPYFRPCVESTNINFGRLEIVNYLFFPKTEGLKPILSEEELIKIVPTFFNAFLLPNKGELQKRKVSDKDSWWDLQRHRPWQEKKFPKLVSAAFGKAGDFAIDKNGDFVVEQGCAWLANSSEVDINTIYAYLALFCSDFFNHLLKAYSKQLAGGEWYNLQTKHVNDIPIPDFFRQPSYATYVEELSTLGKKISNAESFDLKFLNQKIKEVYNKL